MTFLGTINTCIVTFFGTFFMKRELYQELVSWKENLQRKPLILQGARQVGKTYLLKKLASEQYHDYIYCNFEEDPALAELFQGRLTADHLLRNLSFYFEKKIMPQQTLIILDEIQASQHALTSLKYFCEQAREYHVIAAGSLLGVSVGGHSAFPVGKVDFLELYPLNFLEYLEAIGKSVLVELLVNKKDYEPLPQAIHANLLRYFNGFLYIGGMPEVVQNYVDCQDITQLVRLKDNICKVYENDFSKYATAHESIKISNLWQTLPSQLARENKKFKLSEIGKNIRFSQYELALEWLRKAGLVYLAYNVSTAKLPIRSYIEPNKFKLYYLDTGLLAAKLRASPKMLALQQSLYTEYKGALIENYVAKEIYPVTDEYLYYWTSKSAAEVDFVVEINGHVIPLEVKSGFSKHKQSLLSFQKKYNPPVIVRFSPRNFIREGSFINLPLYYACLIRKLQF